MNILKSVGAYELKTYAKQKIEGNRTEARGSAAEPTVEAAKGDTVSLSSLSKEIQSAREKVIAAPDVRAEKVEALKQAISEGRYEINPNKIAAKMLGSIFNEMA